MVDRQSEHPPKFTKLVREEDEQGNALAYLLAVVCTLMCVAIVVLTVLSYSVPDPSRREGRMWTQRP